MLGELLMAVITKALDGRFFDRPVHPLDLPVRPGMVDLGEPMLDVFSRQGISTLTPCWPTQLGDSNQQGIAILPSHIAKRYRERSAVNTPPGPQQRASKHPSPRSVSFGRSRGCAVRDAGFCNGPSCANPF